MERIKSYLLGSAILVFVALVLALAHPDVRRAVAEEFKDVRVINTESQPANVRDVDNPTRQGVNIFLLGGNPNGGYTVPNGKRLVIEYVDARIETFGNCSYLYALLGTDEGGIFHYYYPTRIGQYAFAQPIYGLSQETRAYVDENTTVELRVQAQDCQVGLHLARISGYLVDMQ